MKKLIIARHGDYILREEVLSDNGRRQFESLVGLLHPHLGDGSRIVLASTVPYASMSGDVMAEAWDCPIERHDLLVPSPNYMNEFQSVLDLILSHENLDSVIVVTHMEYADDFPNYVVSGLWGQEPYWYREVNRGEACLIDLEVRRLSLISSGY